MSRHVSALEQRGAQLEMRVSLQKQVSLQKRALQFVFLTLLWALEYCRPSVQDGGLLSRQDSGRPADSLRKTALPRPHVPDETAPLPSPQPAALSGVFRVQKLAGVGCGGGVRRGHRETRG